MNDVPNSFEELLFPEALNEDHNITWYEGYQSVGAFSLEEALREGFVPLSVSVNQEHGLLVHESQFAALASLIHHIAHLRQVHSDNDHSLAESLSIPTEDDGRKLVDAHSPQERTTETSWQRLSMEQQKQYKEWANQLWPDEVDWMALALPVLNDLFGYARKEEIFACFHQALHRVVDDWVQRKTNVSPTPELILEEFQQDLKGLHLRCEERKAQEERIIQLEEVLASSLRSEWETQKNQWEEWVLSQLPNDLPEDERDSALFTMQRLMTHMEHARERTVQNYWGQEPLEVFLEGLASMANACEMELRELCETNITRMAFRKAYQPISDLASLFPQARSMKRKFSFFCGPTNSGKTYAAFEEMVKHDSGVYLAPLRLLALEGQQRMLARGVRASFVTGEEKDIRKDATFVSSTIEMVNTDKVVGCAIIDEVQLLTHPQRGWAWTQALLGLPAHHIILTGSADALPLLQRIAESLHEPFEVHHFERFSALEVLEEPATIKTIQPGTAVICFSRRDVLGLKRQIEEETSHRVAVIYGALSPEVRRQEAARFREGHADVLVATDAIGMGLNLPIRTVLFWTLEKTSQGLERRLNPSETLQISGRAGRYGQVDKGLVGAFVEEELEYIRDVIGEELPELRGPCTVMPLLPHIELLAEVLQTKSLWEVLRYFKHEMWFSDKLLAPRITAAMETLAIEMEDILLGQPWEIQLTFCRAPVSPRAKRSLDFLKTLASDFVEEKPLTLDPMMIVPFLEQFTSEDSMLRRAEEMVQRLTLYRWLSYRFSERFVHAQQADVYLFVLNRFISKTLQNSTLRRRCRSCGTNIPVTSPHAICNKCYQKRRRGYEERMEAR